MRIFAFLYDFLLWPIERLILRPRRRRIVSDAHGRVLEIGVGTWLNLPFYTHLERLVGLEPDEGMLRRARRRMHESRLPLALVKGSAEELPFPDHSFDLVIGTLVCCSIPDPVRALCECRRVLRPGGEIRLLEHGRSNRRIRSALQRLFAPVWLLLFGRCHLDRDPPAMLLEAGFRVRSSTRRESGALAPAFCLHEIVAEGGGLRHDSEGTVRKHHQEDLRQEGSEELFHGPSGKGSRNQVDTGMRPVR
jgi:ubiquinone/menaquinone biosynthesis C-methylase UbiE